MSNYNWCSIFSKACHNVIEKKKKERNSSAFKLSSARWPFFWEGQKNVIATGNSNIPFHH